VTALLMANRSTMRRHLSWKLGFGHATKGQPYSCPWWADHEIYALAYLFGKGIEIPPPAWALLQHDYYSLIARGVAGLGSNTSDSRQALYDRARAAQLKSLDRTLSLVELERQRDVLDQAIRTVEQAESDSKIIFDYAAFCEKNTTNPDCFYDASLLPHPKDAIITAIERQIIRATPDALIDWLRSSATYMWNFLEGVGPDPLPIDGLDVSQVNTPADPEALRSIWASPEYQRDVERSPHFKAIAEKEKQEVEERIATALCIRKDLRHRR
jgi:hypothetical protein